jgi:hypothetical protein
MVADDFTHHIERVVVGADVHDDAAALQFDLKCRLPAGRPRGELPRRREPLDVQRHRRGGGTDLFHGTQHRFGSTAVDGGTGGLGGYQRGEVRNPLDVIGYQAHVFGQSG